MDKIHVNYTPQCARNSYLLFPLRWYEWWRATAEVPNHVLAEWRENRHVRVHNQLHNTGVMPTKLGASIDLLPSPQDWEFYTRIHEDQHIEVPQSIHAYYMELLRHPLFPVSLSEAAMYIFLFSIEMWKRCMVRLLLGSNTNFHGKLVSWIKSRFFQPD